MLNRAQENILDFKARQTAFFQSEPYIRFVEIDPKTGHEIHKLRFTRDVPDHIEAVVADAFNNIRHTLDQAMTASKLALNPGHSAKVYFPFARDADDLEVVIRNKCKGIDPTVLDYVRSLKPYPYPDGHILLSALTQLAGPNKHQALTPVAVIADQGATVVGFDPKKADEFMPWPEWDSAKRELTLFRKRPGSKHYGRVEFTAQIELGDNPAKLKAPVWQMVNFMGQIVAGILEKIEAITLGEIASRS